MKTLRILLFGALCLNIQSCDHSHDGEEKAEYLTLEEKIMAETPAGQRPQFTPEQIKQIDEEKIALAKKNFMKGKVDGQDWESEDYLNGVRFGQTLAFEGNNNKNTRISFALLGCTEPGEYFFGGDLTNTVRVAFVHKEFSSVGLENAGSITFETNKFNYLKGTFNVRVSDGVETHELKDFEFAIYF